jgi:uncharacterized protein YhjY with autotransporter beta-barrel domain
MSSLVPNYCRTSTIRKATALEFHDSDASKLLLKSFELDVAAGNSEGALVSWLSVMHHAQFSDDRDAIRSMLSIMRDFAAGSEDLQHREMSANLERRWQIGIRSEPASRKLGLH